MRANPEPQPLVAAAKCDGTNVSGDANRPGTWIKAQSLQPQTRMRRILAEELICASGSARVSGGSSRCNCQNSGAAPEITARLVEIALGDLRI